MHKKYLLLASLAAILLIIPANTFASTGLTIQPIKVSETIVPGDKVAGVIGLTNASDDDVRVELNIQDFIPVAGAEGIQFVGRAPGVTTVRDWITFDGNIKSFDLKKGESRGISYTIVAPKNAEPGSHFGVLFFKAIKLSDVNATLKIGTQVGVLVFVTIPGNYKQTGNVLDFSGPPFVSDRSPVTFNMKFQNTGTVHFEPKGSIDITNMFGQKVASVPIEGQVVLPTGIKDLSYSWQPGSLLFGLYGATASVYDGSGKLITSEKLSFYALPVWYVVSFLVVLILLFFITKFLKSKVKISINLK